MRIEAGTRLLHYTLSEKIGEGGMGAVWRATDTTLNREVAIKLLPQIFADNAERLARFEREAKLLASLNHPNIAGIFGLHETVGDEGTVRFLAMELIEGQDLSQRLKAGPLPVDQALEIAAQMCAGIEAAHENGVVHRDLKPANVIVAPDGRVRLLDFGLAKAYENDPGGSDPSFSPTMTSAGTVAGMILGTAAYMSPEQARGKPVDRRADLWSFGCVLYEMLTGVSLFLGETISDSLAAILRKDPDWDKLPADTPPMVRLLLRRCLTRDPNKRLRDAGDARLELEQAIDDPRPEALGLAVGAANAADAGASRSSRVAWAVAVIAAVAAVGFALKGGDHAPAANIARRLQIPVPGPTRFGDDLAAPPVVSPDGRYIAFGALDSLGESTLWLRAIDVFEARQIAGTENAQYVFWSPDSKHLGFFLNGRLRRLEVATGRIQPIGGEGSSYPRGATWSRDGKILYAPDSNAGIFMIDADGGEPVQVTTPDPDVPDSSHRWPYFLPDGEHFLFLFWTNDVASREQYGGVYVGSLSGGEPVRVLSDASSVAYADGHILVVQEGNVLAVPFDADRLEVTGETRVVTSDVSLNRANGYANFSVSNDGTLVFARGDSDLPAMLQWVDRQGNLTPTLLEPAPFFDIRVSPEQTRVAAIMPGASGDGELWMIDLERGVRTRIAGGTSWTFSDAMWSGDGKQILYSSQEKGHSDLYTRNADGSGKQEEVLVDELDKVVYDWSADGRYLLFWQMGSGRGTPDLWVYDMQEKTSSELIAGNPGYFDGRFSPAADYVVYTTTESSPNQVFAQARVGGARWQVSTNGGESPHWRRDGKEIVYLDPERRLMSVSVEYGPNGLKLGAPRMLFELDGVVPAFDATLDHDRFLVTMLAETESKPLYVILNWRAGL
jgi:Tol biopolymer transport system component